MIDIICVTELSIRLDPKLFLKVFHRFFSKTERSENSKMFNKVTQI